MGAGECGGNTGHSTGPVGRDQFRFLSFFLLHGLQPSWCFLCQGLGAAGFLPSADSWQPSSPHFLPPFLKCQCFHETCPEQVFNVADLPTPCFLSWAFPPIGRLASSLVVYSILHGCPSSTRASFELLPSLRAPQSLEPCLPRSRCSTGICRREGRSEEELNSRTRGPRGHDPPPVQGGFSRGGVIRAGGEFEYNLHGDRRCA